MSEHLNLLEYYFEPPGFGNVAVSYNQDQSIVLGC